MMAKRGLNSRFQEEEDLRAAFKYVLVVVCIIVCVTIGMNGLKRFLFNGSNKLALRWRSGGKETHSKAALKSFMAKDSFIIIHLQPYPAKNRFSSALVVLSCPTNPSEFPTKTSQTELYRPSLKIAWVSNQHRMISTVILENFDSPRRSRLT